MELIKSQWAARAEIIRDLRDELGFGVMHIHVDTCQSTSQSTGRQGEGPANDIGVPLRMRPRRETIGDMYKRRWGACLVTHEK